MFDIFLSYAREDHEKIQPIVRVLESRGWSVWWYRHMIAGEDFRNRVQELLESVSCVVVIWSENSVKSGWVIDEAQHGEARSILVPVSLDGAKPPLGFGHVHAALLETPSGKGLDFDAMIFGIERILHQHSDTNKIGFGYTSDANESHSFRRNSRERSKNNTLISRIVFNFIGYMGLPILLSSLLGFILSEAKVATEIQVIAFAAVFCISAYFSNRSFDEMATDAENGISKLAAYYFILPTFGVNFLNFSSINLVILSILQFFGTDNPTEGKIDPTGLIFLIALTITIFFYIYRFSLRIISIFKCVR